MAFSMVYSADDEIGKPTDEMIEFVLKVIDKARGINLSDISERRHEKIDFLNIFPGEHYRLLGAMIQELQPQNIIEVGTYTGLSCLTMKKYMPSSAKLYTYDIVPWDRFSLTYLNRSDFLDNRLMQYIADLSDYSITQKHSDIIKTADFFFIDAAKDGVFETRLLNNLRKLKIKNNSILVFDDIRMWNMLRFWRKITYPKIDLSSFGHWTGTGVVQWQNF